MRKIYWKIFIWFWVATSLVIFISAIVSSQVTRKSNNDDDTDTFISTISTATRIMLNTGTPQQFLQWQAYLKQQDNIDLLLVPDKRSNPQAQQVFTWQDQEQLENFRPALAVLAKKNQERSHDRRAFVHKPFVVSQPLLLPDGQAYRLLAKLPPEFFQHYKFNRGNIISRFIIACIITGIVCYLLSLYLARPIRILQRAARRLGRGDFTTRVGKSLTMRKDEIGELAAEFDDMVSRLQALIASRQRLLQDISHELRSPLARLSVALEIAEAKSPQAKKELARIAKESEKLNLLITQILSLSSLDKKVGTVIFDHFDLVTMLKAIIEDANYEAQHLPATITFEGPAEFAITANQNLLRSGIENIIRNALRYTEKNQPILIKLTVPDNLNTELKQDIVLTIEDSGPGIPEEKLANIFDIFYRVDDSRTEKTGGFGLGLAIAKKTINLHQGTIRAYNLTPHGLGIEIHLPVNIDKSQLTSK